MDYTQYRVSAEKADLDGKSDLSQFVVIQGVSVTVYKTSGPRFSDHNLKKFAFANAPFSRYRAWNLFSVFVVIFRTDSDKFMTNYWICKFFGAVVLGVASTLTSLTSKSMDKYRLLIQILSVLQRNDALALITSEIRASKQGKLLYVKYI